MIEEKNKHEFYKIYSNRNLSLKNRFCCYGFTRVEYLPGYGVRLSCNCGEGVLVLKRADLPDLKTEEDFVCHAVSEWNAGRTNW